MIDLRMTRMARGLTLKQLADRMECSPTWLSKIESGDRDPSWATALLLATHLGCSLDTLAGWNSSYEEGYRRGAFDARETMKDATRHLCARTVDFIEKSSGQER